MTLTYVLAVIALVVLAGVALWLRSRSWKRREAAMRELLDGADALEAQILDYRSRMHRLKSVLSQLPSDMTATAMSSIEPEAQVHKALREVLAHRLWIQRHGISATQGALDTAVQAIVRSRESLAQQLALLDEVASQLAQAGTGLRHAYQEASAAMQMLHKIRGGPAGDDNPPQIRVDLDPERPPTRH